MNKNISFDFILRTDILFAKNENEPFQWILFTDGTNSGY